jgi:hypothetical protein
MVKKSKALVPKGKAVVSTAVTPSGIADIQKAATAGISPEIKKILEDSSLSLSAKRRKVLEIRGKAPARKKKYSSVEERKAAAKERAKKRKETRNAELAPYGLRPKKREGMTPEVKKAKRAAKARAKRAFMKEAATEFPDLAKKYGLTFRKII